ncbi:hypothetical protein ACET3Z_030641 [Daucus carota]
MFDWKEFLMILPVVLFLAWCIYYLSCNESRYYCSFSSVIANINHLIQKIWSELKRNTVEILGVVFKLALAALGVCALGDANRWNVWWIAGIAVFVTLCYCFRVCVEMKRAQLTRTCHYVNRRNNKKVWFFTITHAFEFLLPLLCLFLAYAYFMELHFQKHHTENDWKNVATAIKVAIVFVSSVIVILSACCKRHYVTPADQNQLLPISTDPTFPRNWNEVFLALPADVDNPTVQDANAAEMMPRESEDQVVADARQTYVKNQPVAADPPEVI